jgi:hypothetical protein
LSTTSVPRPARKSALAADEKYREANLECAEIVLADRERYGEGSLMVLWAELVMKNYERAAEAAKHRRRAVLADEPGGAQAQRLDGADGGARCQAL